MTEKPLLIDICEHWENDVMRTYWEHDKHGRDWPEFLRWCLEDDISEQPAGLRHVAALYRRIKGEASACELALNEARKHQEAAMVHTAAAVKFLGAIG